MSNRLLIRESLAERIAGEVVLSKRAGTTLRKWREIFDVTQAQTAKHLKISSSVVSDYESGRRTPGTRFLKKFVDGIISIDMERGGRVLRELSYLVSNVNEAIISIREFQTPIKAIKICRMVNGIALACREQLSREIYGYTIVDSVKAIQTLSGTDFYQLFGSTTERAMIFTNVTSGRSPMVAIRVHPLKPRMVVIQGPEEIDALALYLAEVEHLPLVLSKMATVNALVKALEVSQRRNTGKEEKF